MISSAALPKVAFRNPPMAGPERCARVSVPSPTIAARGTRDAAASTNTHTDSGELRAISHDTGAAASSRFSWFEASARRSGRIPDQGRTFGPWSWRFVARPSVGKLLDVLFFGAGQEIEEGVEAAVECAPQLGDGAVDRMQRHAGRAAV